ncbi:AMP-binding protein [Aquisalimonas asiatica]|uniref:Acyl-CoA synthetase (AMP-forming)/AMP-acid ligase II n=1 Tax=Aquisalimonas asiatica TaxID=406100 RepID=A0A1H8Q1D1_9GAMM|nr:AMP-binding protein [Aquisalimonas asiatica]SEO48010.1 Acyl-CoA synthetase (AMP-forming)/AMP-acid ligase II [Aquisalimonas asiatica]
MNVATILERQAETRPDAHAIIDRRYGLWRHADFGALARRAAGIAARLEQQGLRRGDPVLVLQPMSAELYAVLVALFRLGLVAVIIDPGAGREHLQRCCQLHPPRAMIASPRAHALRLLMPELRRIPLKFTTSGWIPGARHLRPDRTRTPPPVAQLPSDAPALLTFTSGSTGMPKATVRTHGQLLAQHDALTTALALQPGDRDLSTLPIFVLANLGSGVTSIIPPFPLQQPGRVRGEAIRRVIESHRATRASASPAFFERLAEHCEQRGTTVPRLRQIHAGGAPVFPDLLARLAAIMPQGRVTAVYGSTEAEPIADVAFDAVTPREKRAMATGSGLLAGQPVPAIRIAILPEQDTAQPGPFTAETFRDACLPPGRAGEIVVTGPHVLPGYLNGVGDRETKFEVDGVRWHRTGDSGYLDHAGQLWLLGRSGARLDTGDATLYPFAVECAARQVPGVAACALTTVDGQHVLAVEARPGKRPDERALQRQLAWAGVKRVVTVPRIPMDRRHNAKVDYTRLPGEVRDAMQARDQLTPRSISTSAPGQ